MMRLVRPVWMGCVCMLLGSVTCPALAAAVEKSDAQDARLRREVTCNARCTDLSRLAAILSAQTQVRIRVQEDIRSEKITIFVERRPLGTILNDVTRLFGYRLARQETGDGPPTYLLWSDTNRRDEERVLREQARKDEESRRAARLGRVRDIYTMSERDLDSLPEEERWFAGFVRSEAFRPQYGALSVLTVAEREILAKRGVIARRLDTLTPEAQAQMRKGFQGWDIKDPESITTVEIVMDSQRMPVGTLNLDRIMVLAADASGPIAGRDAPLTPEAARGHARALDEASAARNLKRFAAGNAATDLRDERLKKSMDAPEALDYPGVLEKIAEITGIPIISDYYTTGQLPMVVGSRPVAEVIENAPFAFGRQWGWNRGALLFRHQEWPNLAPAEVPLDIYEALEKAGPKETLNLAQCLAASPLTPEQFVTLARDKYHVPWAKDEQAVLLFRFLNTLRPDQLARVTSPTGLDMGRLEAKSKQAFQRFHDQRWSRLGYQPIVHTLKMAFPDPESASATFTLRITVDGAEKDSLLYTIVARPKPVAPVPPSASAGAEAARG